MSARDKRRLGINDIFSSEYVARMKEVMDRMQEVEEPAVTEDAGYEHLLTEDQKFALAAHENIPCIMGVYEPGACTRPAKWLMQAECESCDSPVEPVCDTHKDQLLTSMSGFWAAWRPNRCDNCGSRVTLRGPWPLPGRES